MRTARWLLLATFLGTLGFNGYLWGWRAWRQRDLSWFRQPQSYRALYTPAESPRILGTRYDDRGRVLVDVGGVEAAEWRVSVDDEPAVVVSGDVPAFRAEPGQHDYRVVPASLSATTGVVGPAIALDLTLTPGADYAASGNSSDDVLSLNATNVPLDPRGSRSLEAFCRDPATLSADDRAAIEAELQQVEFAADDDTLARIGRLVAHLRSRLQGCEGIPSDAMAIATPRRQFEMALAGESKVWCWNFAEIYCDYANAAGIPTRRVNVEGRVGVARLANHAFAESYCAETGKWAYVDPTVGIAHVTNGAGQPLNTVDLLHLHAAGATAGCRAVVYRDGELTTVPYAELHDVQRQTFAADARVVFENGRSVVSFPIRPVARMLEHLVNPQSVYTLNGGDARRVATVVAFHAMWLQAALLIALWAIAWRRSTQRAPVTADSPN